MPEKEAAGEDGEELDEEGNPVLRQNASENLDQSGELLFVRNLKKSRLFSSEEEYTGVVSIQKSEFLENGNDFEIQLKFNVLVEAYPWGDATSGTGAMGSRGMN